MFSTNDGDEGEMDEHDLNWLPIEYRSVYRRPNIILALEEGATIGQVSTSIHHTYFVINICCSFVMLKSLQICGSILYVVNMSSRTHLFFICSPHDFGQIRDAYRKICINMSPMFTGLPQSQITFKQYTLAYHLCRKSLEGTPKSILVALQESPYFDDIKPDDCLPLLKPLEKERKPGDKASPYRGFRQLAVRYSSSTYQWGSSDDKTKKRININGTPTGSMSGTMGSLTSFVQTKFVFDIHYCMRRHTITKTYDECQVLMENFSSDLLAVPGFPSMSIFSVFDSAVLDSTGAQLASFLNRTHRLLANKGLFSPYLMHFLEIPYETVQTEEEGRIVQILDTPLKPNRTVAHIIDEEWLKRWRAFVMGRGARRYKPPGPIDNARIKSVYDEEIQGSKRSLEPSIDYRSVNYNVWHYYQLVHGGGPELSRLDDDIYSAVAYSFLQAVIMLQRHCRKFLARCRRYNLQSLELSKQESVIELLTKQAKQQIDDNVNSILKHQKEQHKKQELDIISTVTVSIYRNKKNLEPEESLHRRKGDHLVFARASGAKKELTTSIVEDIQPIIHIADTSEYTVELSGKQGIPFSLQKGLSSVIISNRGDTNGIDDGSHIVEINGYPVATLDYEDVKALLEKSKFPLTLKMKRPMDSQKLPELNKFIAPFLVPEATVLKVYQKKETPPFIFKEDKEDGRLRAVLMTKQSDENNALLSMAVKSINKKLWYTYSKEFNKDKDKFKQKLTSGKKKIEVIYERMPEINIKDDAVKVHATKLWLSRGLKFLRHHHNDKKWKISPFSSGGYLSIMKLTGTHLYIKKKIDPTKVESELWENISLFSIKFVVAGYHSEFFRKKGSSVDLLSCFEIVTEEGSSILLEVMKKKDEEYVKKKEYIDAEVARVMKYTPHKVEDPAFMAGLEKSYKNRVDEEERKLREAGEFVVETPEQLLIRRQRYCELIVGSLKAIVDEIRSSKVFLGTDGIPIRRKDARIVLKKNEA